MEDICCYVESSLKKPLTLGHEEGLEWTQIEAGSAGKTHSDAHTRVHSPYAMQLDL